METLEKQDVFLPEGKTYIVGLTVKSGSSDPSLQIYFNSITEAIMSMFHPSMQKFLAASKDNIEFDDSLEIYLNVFFVKEQVIVKRPQNMGANAREMQVERLINDPKNSIFAESKALEAAIQHDCHLEGTPSFLISVPVHFDLTAIKENYYRILQAKNPNTQEYRVMDGNLPVFLDAVKDINGKLNGLVFCDLNLLLHVESYLLDKTAIVDIIRQYMNEYYGIVGDTYDPSMASAKGYMTISQIIAYTRSVLRENKDLYLTRSPIKAVQTTTGMDLSPTSITPSLSAVTARSGPMVGDFGDPNKPMFSKSGMAIDTFRGVPYDALRLIGINMDLETINRTCRTSQTFNRTFCSYGPNNENFDRVEQFWREKVRKDYGEYKENGRLTSGWGNITWLEYYRRLVGVGLSERIAMITRGLTTLQLLQLACLLDTIKIVRYNDNGSQEIMKLLTDVPYEITPARGMRAARIAHTGLTPIIPLLDRVGGRTKISLDNYLKGTQTAAQTNTPVMFLLRAALMGHGHDTGSINFSEQKTDKPYSAVTQVGLTIEERRSQIIDFLRPYVELLNNSDYLIFAPLKSVQYILAQLLTGNHAMLEYLLNDLVEDQTKQISSVTGFDLRGAPPSNVPIYALNDRSRLVVKRILVKLFNVSNPNKEPDQT